MAIEPELTPLFDFLCEHSPSKSRVMALIGPYDGPRFLTAVLTCKGRHHAYQAVRLLRRALASRDTAVVEEDLHALASTLPDAPAQLPAHGHGARSLRNMARLCRHNVLPA